jgi:hypothetical protein
VLEVLNLLEEVEVKGGKVCFEFLSRAEFTLGLGWDRVGIRLGWGLWRGARCRVIVVSICLTSFSICSFLTYSLSALGLGSTLEC